MALAKTGANARFIPEFRRDSGETKVEKQELS